MWNSLRGGDTMLLRWTMVLALMVLGRVGLAIPELVVLLPTANPAPARSLSLAIDQFGAPAQWHTTHTRAIYMQCALSEQFDFGCDLMGLGQSPQYVANLRYVALLESARQPGVAVGALNLMQGAAPTYYLVGTRTTASGRWHVGALYQAGRLGWGAGYQTRLGQGIDLALEHYHAPDGNAYWSVGVARQVNDALALSVYYTHCHRSPDGCTLGVSLSFAPIRLF